MRRGEEVLDGGKIKEPGWPGWSQFVTVCLAAAIWEGETGHWPMVFWSSLESTDGCFLGERLREFKVWFGGNGEGEGEKMRFVRPPLSF